MRNYKAYLFDMDGTLVDSEKLKGKALVKTCHIFNGNANVDLYKEVMGESWEQVASHFFNKIQINPNIAEFNFEFKKIYQEILLQELKTNKNAKNLLSVIKNKGKKIGVVSSAFGWMVNQILTQLNLTNFFDVVISKEQVTKHKPNPEAYLLALKKLSLPGKDVLVFEDSKSGLMAAQKAKCDSIAFRHEFNANHDFSLALKEISDFNEVREMI